jgi:hypothetical protein
MIREILGAKYLECAGCDASSKRKAALIWAAFWSISIVSNWEVIHARRMSPVLFGLGGMGLDKDLRRGESRQRVRRGDRSIVIFMAESSLRDTLTPWKGQWFLEIAATCEGALAILMESPTATLVRVSDIRADEWGVTVIITCVPLPGSPVWGESRLIAATFRLPGKYSPRTPRPGMPNIVHGSCTSFRKR